MKIIETNDEVVLVESDKEVVTLETTRSSIISDQERYADTFEYQFQSGPPGTRGVDGKSAYQIALDNGFVGTKQEWLDHLGTQTPETPYDVAVRNGFTGTEQEWLDSLEGKSAYRIALDNGFVGTQQEWLDSLKVTATLADDGKILTNDGSDTFWMTIEDKLNSENIQWDLGEFGS